MDAVSRNERRLMRQRGAGTRNIDNNIEFGLSFPTPTNARRSKTPSTGGRASRRATKTPTHRSVSQEPSATIPKVPEAATISRPSKRKSSFLDAVTEGPAPETGKKRKLNGTTETPSGQTEQRNNAFAGNGPSIPRRRASRKADVITIAGEADHVEDLAQVAPDDPDSGEGPEESFLEDQDKENDEPDLGTAQSKRPKRKSIARRFARPKKRSSTGSLQNELVNESREARGEQSTRRDGSAAGPSVGLSLAAKDTTFPLSVRHENGVAIPTKAPRSKQPSPIDEIAPPTNVRTNITREPSALIADEEPAEDESTLSIQDGGPSKKRRKRKSIIVKKRNGRKASAQSAASASPVPRRRRRQTHTASPAPTPYREPFENEDETYLPEEVSPEPPTPAPTKKSRKATRTIPSIESDNPAPSRHRSTSSEPRSGYPITTHRLVNTSALPTISEELEGASGDELDHLTKTRAAPNAVDVLAQICRESVATALTATLTTSQGGSLKLRTAALESFGHELEARLFDMSAAVENRLTLEARVRSSKREKNAVQGRWMELRREREEVALRTDAVRRRHTEGEERGRESWGVSEACFGVGAVGERERGTEGEGLEGLMGSVGRVVSGGEGGGALQRVREFNARMEGLLGVLREGR